MSELMVGQQVQSTDGKWYRWLGGPKHQKSSWEEVPTVKQNIPTLQQSMQEELATRTGPEKFVAGAGAALDRAAYGTKKLFTPLTGQEQQRLDLNKQITKTTPGMLGQITGDVAMTSAPFGAVSGVARQVPSILGRLATNIGGSTALGAGYGALTNPDDRTTGAVVGGAGAGAGSLLGSLLGGMFRPAAGSAAQELQRRGVPLTAGQASAPGGLGRRVEDAMRGTSSQVAKRQAEALEKWSQGVVQQAVPKTTSVSGTQIPAGGVTGAGRNAIAEAAKMFDDAYDDAFAQMGRLKPDSALSTNLSDVVRRYGPMLTKSDADTLAEEVARVNGEMTAGLVGRAVKDLRSSYQKLADTAFAAGKGRLGQAYKDVMAALDNMTARQYPQAAAAVKAVDQQYAQFLPIQRAAGKIGAEEGVFSPKQLLGAVREMDKSAGKSQFARGATRPELMQEAEKAIGVLGPTIPPVGPGTAEKMAPMLAAQNWLTVAPAMAAQGMYTRPVQGLLTGAYPWQAGIDPAWFAALASASSNR